MIISSSLYNNYTGSSLYLLWRASMDNAEDVVLTGEAPGHFFGVSVSTAGDVNGDGYSDVIVGAERFNENTGSANIFYGGIKMNEVTDLTLTGEAINDKFGFSVSTAGDVNRDGFSDVIVGAKEYYYTTGRTYLFYGGVTMDSITDIVLTGVQQNNQFGISVSTAGDQLTRNDTVKVYLRNASPPYALTDSALGIIDSISFSRLFKFLVAPSGYYYLVVKHFNTIETWSKSEVNIW
ncbi:MAG: FG-GAP repeat protein [Ignavibacteria bacterium]|nr:FG-GAP repeat protein [Ignavibacteria bacterium]